MPSAMRRLQLHRRAGTGRRPDLEPAADALGALLHRRESEASRPELRSIWIEADAVVLDLEQQPAVFSLQPYHNPVRSRMAKRVLQRLLCDPEDLAVASGITLELEVSLERDLRRLEPSQHLDVLAQRSAQTVALQVRRTKLEDE